MRVLIHTLCGWLTYTTLRVRQIRTNRRQRFLLVGSLVIMALGFVVWRASLSPAKTAGFPRVMLDLPPTPSVAGATPRPADTEPPVIPNREVRQAELTADMVNPFSGMTLHEEQHTREVAQRTLTDQRRLERSKLAVEIAKQEHELARVHKETRDLLRPRSRAVIPRIPALPDARPLAIASQSALVLYRGARVTAWPGTTLGAWTVETVFPDGVVIRHGDRQAFLPLSFPARKAN